MTIQKDNQPEPHWTDKHITFGFTVWDETGAYPIGVFATHEEAKQALIKYAKTLEPKEESSENHQSKP